LSLIAAAGLYFLYIGPTYEEIKLHQDEIEKFDKAFSEIAEAQNILEELTSSYASISREDLLKLEIFLPQKIDFARVVQNIGGIVGAHNVSMENIEVGSDSKKVDEGKKIRKHEITFNIDSIYGDFLSIISDIERNLQLSSVSSIELNPTRIGRENLVIAGTVYKINLVLYSFE